MQYLTILSILVYSQTSAAQSVTWQELTSMPEPVTNNAVTSANIDGVTHVFSFAGMDSTKTCGQSHLRSYMYNTSSGVWTSIADLPNELGGIVAAGASTIKNEIYIIGGYHIRDNCSEVSSRAVHKYNSLTDDYTKLADLPIAIDDHVQAVYSDSLLYVITGWSNSTNVTQVQIYNPSNDEWTFGTPVPNDPQWRVFGASGSIINGTIYFSGGASLSCNSTYCFPPTNLLRKGEIDPNDPTQITWTSEETDDAVGYRMAAVSAGSSFLWLGGSDLTYNFDGIDYNGTGGVDPNQKMTSVNLESGERAVYDHVLPPAMDFRGIGKLDDHNFILCGGMGDNQVVSDKVYHVTVSGLVHTKNHSDDLAIFPNPAIDEIFVSGIDTGYKFHIIDFAGKTVMSGRLKSKIDVSRLLAGRYHLLIKLSNDENRQIPFIKL